MSRVARFLVGFAGGVILDCAIFVGVVVLAMRTVKYPAVSWTLIGISAFASLLLRAGTEWRDSK